MKKIKSFTLAEVLITLVVIGIIAAITVPVVMANHKKTETTARLKKFYSTFSNAVRLAEIEQGIPTTEWDSSLDPDKYFDKYLSKYFNYNKRIRCDEPDSECDYRGEGMHAWIASVYLDDGTIIGLDWTFQVYYDVNGDKKPNEYGRDFFSFGVKTSSYDTENFINDYGKFKENVFTEKCIYGEQCNSREFLIEKCGKKEPASRNLCTLLLFNDGWEFKNDYPLKL